jgi:membrane protein DedA with SNARE-associated domain
VTDWVQDLLGGGSYLVLLALVALENLFPPIPSEIVLPFAGALVADEALWYPGAVLAATAGSVLGALVLYAVGRYGGRPLIYRHGRILRLTERDLDRADAWFDARGWWIVLLGRLIPGVRSVVSVPAGASEMPLLPFVALTTLGSLVWNAALIGAGWALGENWKEASAVIEDYKVVAYALVAVALLAFVLWVVRLVRSRSAAGAS